MAGQTRLVTQISRSYLYGSKNGVFFPDQLGAHDSAPGVLMNYDLY